MGRFSILEIIIKKLIIAPLQFSPFGLPGCYQGLSQAFKLRVHRMAVHSSPQIAAHLVLSSFEAIAMSVSGAAEQEVSKDGGPPESSLASEVAYAALAGAVITKH